MLKSFLKDYNYCKHLKLAAAIYVPLIAIDLTVGYVVAKKVINAALLEDMDLDFEEDEE